MNLDKPTSRVKQHIYTISPVPDDGTLVDDSVALVDDLVAHVGGQSTPTNTMRFKTKPLKSSATIRKYR